MRNLFAFFQRFQIFLAFVALQILAIGYYVQYMNFPKSVVLAGISTAQGKVNGVLNEGNKLLNLNATNIRLQKENAVLRQKTKQSFIRIGNGSVMIDDTLFKQQYTYIPALVIKSSTNRLNNFFTVDVGKNQGVKIGDGVISAEGIVGIIYATSTHYSLIRSVLTEELNIDIMVKDNGAFGLLKWNGRNPRFGSLTGISNDVKLQKWQKIVTRGGSGMFPRNIPVGMISKIEPIEGQPLWNVTFVFSENYRRTQRVYIVKNLLLKEQNKLENLIPADKKDERNTKTPK
jgi:rod shape-determining protein MreC